MATTTPRSPARPSAGVSSGPYVNAALVLGALGYGGYVLFTRGGLAWPPGPLLQGAYTVAGCLGLIGPIVLGRREQAQGGLGELLWMSGGLLLWLYDLVALFKGQAQGQTWATPLGMAPLGVVMLAVLIAGWRIHGLGSRPWSWTNITGWVLGIFWIGMGQAALWLARPLGL